MLDKRWLVGKWPCWAGLATIIVIVVWWWFLCGPATTVLLVRHADRAQNQDLLSSAGEIRSEELVHVARNAGLTAIIRSDAIRAKQTAEPLATALGIAPIVLPGADVQAFANEIRNHHRGGTVLVVGHSNTTPQIIAALGGPNLPQIADDEFDNLLVLTLCRCRGGPVKLASLQYGAVSP